MNNLINFHEFSPADCKNLIFQNFQIFAFSRPGVKKIVASLLAYEFSFLFDQMIELTCLENDTLGFSILFDISIGNS